MAATDRLAAPRASHPAFIVSTRLDAGDERRNRLVPFAHDEIDLRVGRRVTDRRDRVQDHQQVADALEAQQQDRRARTGRAGRGASPQERPGQTQPRVGQADQPSLPPVAELQMGEQGAP